MSEESKNCSCIFEERNSLLRPTQCAVIKVNCLKRGGMGFFVLILLVDGYILGLELA